MKQLRIKINILAFITIFLVVAHLITMYKCQALIPATAVGRQFSLFLDVFNPCSPEQL